MRQPFADRLAALVEERRSQVCLGLDPEPGEPSDVRSRLEELIARAGPACVAVKPQLACFERLGAPGIDVLASAVAAARDAGLLVVADGKRGDVPVSAAAYAEALFGPPPGLGADAATVSPLLGSDSVEPLLRAAEDAGGGVFALVRTSNPGASEVLDLPAPEAPLWEHLAGMVARWGPRLAGESGLSGAGAVVGATAPQHLARARELLPDSILLVPGVGAQGGDPSTLGAALGEHPASLLVPVSRAIAHADDPMAATERLRAELWSLSER